MIYTVMPTAQTKLPNDVYSSFARIVCATYEVHPMKEIYTLCRYVVAFLILFYGFAKLNGAQFTILDSQLDRPMREVSGFWLTWYYFGYSLFYGNFIALVQVLGGVLLMFRRTTLLAACVLFGLVGNIILVNIFYGIDPGALMVAIFIEVCLAFILWQHRRELLDVFWTVQNRVYPSREKITMPGLTGVAVRSVVVIIPALFTYYVANYNNRLPTPLDGRWEVTEVSGQAVSPTIPTHIYFERNRAKMAVFRYADSWETHHFEVKESEQALGMWEQWLRKGEPLFQGSYRLADTTLELEGLWGEVPVHISLEKLP
jgi:hypothetical protein